jgi:hypothetical protein
MHLKCWLLRPKKEAAAGLNHTKDQHQIPTIATDKGTGKKPSATRGVFKIVPRKLDERDKWPLVAATMVMPKQMTMQLGLETNEVNFELLTRFNIVQALERRCKSFM